MIVDSKNCHEIILSYIEEKEINIETYENMKNTYADMVLNHYYFIIERDLIADILVDLTYILSCQNINKGRVIGTIDMEEDDYELDD
tara:strand:- start:25 stop:285 length:261 start_codon:yes stop_codon:yes gene_type:complete